MNKVINNNFGDRKTISGSDSEYLPSNPKLAINPLTIIGAELTIPATRMKIVTTEFDRDPAFDDAIALVEILEGEAVQSGDHLQTPWGVVKIA